MKKEKIHSALIDDEVYGIEQANKIASDLLGQDVVLNYYSSYKEFNNSKIKDFAVILVDYYLANDELTEKYAKKRDDSFDVVRRLYHPGCLVGSDILAEIKKKYSEAIIVGFSSDMSCSEEMKRKGADKAFRKSY